MLQVPGFRFSPSDLEVICLLLNKAGLLVKNLGGRIFPNGVIQDFDFYSLNPDQFSLNEERDGAYFYAKLHKKDADSKPDRSTSDGCWEEIGGDVAIISNRSGIVGYKSTFVFRFFSADDGKDNFYMEEFRLNPKIRSGDPNIRNNIKNLVVCKVERMSPNCFLIPQVQWVKGGNECSDDEVEEEKTNTSPEAV